MAGRHTTVLRLALIRAMTAALATLSATSGACTAPIGRADDALLAQSAGEIVDLAPYQAAGNSVRRFRCTNRRNPVKPAAEYVVLTCPGVHREGSLLDFPPGDLQPYLSSDMRTAASQAAWPDPPDSSGGAFYLSFEPPLLYQPAQLVGATETRARARFSYHDRAGRKLFVGTVTRSLCFVDRGTVTVQGQTHVDCLQLRISTQLRAPLLASVDILEQVWLAREVGEVRKLVSWKGSVLLARLDERVEYELLPDADGPLAPSGPLLAACGENAAAAQPHRSGQNPASVPPPDRHPVGSLPEHWAGCAVFLQPRMPHPQMGGLAAEIVDGPPALPP